MGRDWGIPNLCKWPLKGNENDTPLVGILSSLSSYPVLYRYCNLFAGLSIIKGSWSGGVFASAPVGFYPAHFLNVILSDMYIIYIYIHVYITNFELLDSTRPIQQVSLKPKMVSLQTLSEYSLSLLNC